MMTSDPGAGSRDDAGAGSRDDHGARSRDDARAVTRSGRRGRGRVVNVSSMAHRRAAALDLDDVTATMTSRGGGRYAPSLRQYPLSKLANILFTRELARRLGRSSVACILSVQLTRYSAIGHFCSGVCIKFLIFYLHSDGSPWPVGLGLKESLSCLQCFDTVGWAPGRAFGEASNHIPVNGLSYR